MPDSNIDVYSLLIQYNLFLARCHITSNKLISYVETRASVATVTQSMQYVRIKSR